MCDFHGFYIDMCLITGWYSKGGKHVAHITGHMGCKTQLRMDISSLRTTRLVNIRGTLEEVNHTKLYRCVDIHPLNFPYANRICDHIIIDYKFIFDVSNLHRVRRLSGYSLGVVIFVVSNFAFALLKPPGWTVNQLTVLTADRSGTCEVVDYDYYKHYLGQSFSP
jgi:hypothetical protein